MSSILARIQTLLHVVNCGLHWTETKPGLPFTILTTSKSNNSTDKQISASNQLKRITESQIKLIQKKKYLKENTSTD